MRMDFEKRGNRQYVVVSGVTTKEDLQGIGQVLSKSEPKLHLDLRNAEVDDHAVEDLIEHVVHALSVKVSLDWNRLKIFDLIQKGVAVDLEL